MALVKASEGITSIRWVASDPNGGASVAFCVSCAARDVGGSGRLDMIVAERVVLRRASSGSQVTSRSI